MEGAVTPLFLVAGKSRLRIMKTKKIIVKKGQEYHLLPLTDVAYFFADQKMVFCIDQQNRKHRTEYASLQDAYNTLDPRQFFKAGRKVILHLEHIKGYRPAEFGKLSVEVATSPPVRLLLSQTTAPFFRNWIRNEPHHLPSAEEEE